jgi:hypothetical protein
MGSRLDKMQEISCHLIAMLNLRIATTAISLTVIRRQALPLEGVQYLVVEPALLVSGIQALNGIPTPHETKDFATARDSSANALRRRHCVRIKQDSNKPTCLGMPLGPQHTVQQDAGRANIRGCWFNQEVPVPDDTAMMVRE